MVAMVARLTGTSGGVAFNLGLSLVFALSAIGAYGLLFNLLTTLKHNPRSKTSESRISDNSQPVVFSALLAPFFILYQSFARKGHFRKPP
jgi:uncharacterized membrane protein